MGHEEEKSVDVPYTYPEEEPLSQYPSLEETRERTIKIISERTEKLQPMSALAKILAVLTLVDGCMTKVALNNTVWHTSWSRSIVWNGFFAYLFYQGSRYLDQGKDESGYRWITMAAIFKGLYMPRLPKTSLYFRRFLIPFTALSTYMWYNSTEETPQISYERLWREIFNIEAAQKQMPLAKLQALKKQLETELGYTLEDIYKETEGNSGNHGHH